MSHATIWHTGLPLLMLAATYPALAGPLAPTRLTCESLTRPEGVDVLKPRFSWLPAHTERGEKQTAYQILVSTNPAVAGGDVWDSGRVNSEDFTNIVYQGKPLASDTTYYWKVRYYDSKGVASDYSRVESFSTGLFQPGDWKGKWIGGANQLRKEFVLAGPVRRAKVFISGLGYYELRINGHRVGDHVLDPGWTPFEKRVLYAAYDVTPYLRRGPNAVAISLGQGWFRNRAALLQLNVTLEDGQRFELSTDSTWQVKQGPILEDSVYHGETYDARLETPGWDLPNYAAEGWKPATVVDPPKGALSAQLMQPIRVTDVLVPRKLSSPKPGVYVYDLGQNISGWVQLKVKGPAGAKVRIRHSELLFEDGTLNVENLRRARATDFYILKGGGDEEVYEPRFTYHGFRYVELTGYPGTPTLETIRAKVVHTGIRQTGNFVCSKDVLNQIQRIILWGIRTNLHSVPTDCDQRDERKGWTADAHLAAETALLNFDIVPVYRNFLRLMRDEQDADGNIPDTVPFSGGRRDGDPAWGSAYPIIAWYVYEQTGDKTVLEEHYEGIKAYTEQLRRRSVNHIVPAGPYGDWVPIVPTRGDLVSTAYYYYSVDLTAKIAAVLGKQEEAATYRKLGEQIIQAFDKAFWDEENRCYSNCTQTAQVLPLFFGMAQKERVGPAATRLWRDVVYYNNTHLTTGILGAKYIMEVLGSRNPDVAYDLATQTTYPSWGYMLERGATTVWELWQEKTGYAMNSHNHPMFGSVGAYFFRYLAGIQHDSGAPGYRKIRIQPQMIRDLQWASATIDTVRGLVVSDWKRTPESVELKAVVPFGSEAEIQLPKFNLHRVEVLESGKPLWRDGTAAGSVAGVVSVRELPNAIIITAGSGEYHFSLKGE